MMEAGVGTGWDGGRVDEKSRGAGEILGTTDPTLGMGEEMRGDMEGMADSWESRVTSVPTNPPSPLPSRLLSPGNKTHITILRYDF